MPRPKEGLFYLTLLPLILIFQYSFDLHRPTSDRFSSDVKSLPPRFVIMLFLEERNRGRLGSWGTRASDYRIEIKEFLEQKSLSGNRRADDIYSHVPALEGQLIHQGTILQFLKEYGFSLPARCQILEDILRLLPSLLHREV